MTFDDVVCHFSGFCASRGNLARWFWILYPFAIHVCRHKVIGAIKYPEEKWQFLRFFLFWAPKRVAWGRKAPHGIPKTVRNVLIIKSALACSDMKLSANSHFGHFWVIDPTSEITGWPRTLNSGVNGFISWQATRWFFNRSSNSLRSQTRGGRTNQPPPPVPWKMAKWRVPARVKTPDLDHSLRSSSPKPSPSQSTNSFSFYETQPPPI